MSRYSGPKKRSRPLDFEETRQFKRSRQQFLENYNIGRSNRIKNQDLIDREWLLSVLPSLSYKPKRRKKAPK